MKILLVTHTFAPYNASGSVRVAALASFLLERGHDMRVLTAAPLAYPPTLKSEFPVERVVATHWLDPLDIVRRLGRRGIAQVSGTELGLPSHPGFRRILRTLNGAVAIPDAQIGWYRPAVRAGRVLLRDWKPDIIYASALPFSAHLVARRLAGIAGVPWVAEFRDLFADNPYSNLPAWRGGIDRAIERRVIATASACVTVSEPMAETLRQLHGKPAIVALNGFDAKESSPVAAETAGGPLRILYSGIIYPGRRDPSALFAAMASLKPASIEVVFRGQDLRGVAEAATRYGVADQVRILPLLPHAEILFAQQQADALLLLLWDDPRDAGTFTGKLFEYIGSGRPVLAVGRDDGVAVDLIRSRRLGLAGKDPVQLAVALRGWISEKQETGRIAGPPASARNGLSRRDQFGIIETLLRDLHKAETVS